MLHEDDCMQFDCVKYEKGKVFLLLGCDWHVLQLNFRNQAEARLLVTMIARLLQEQKQDILKSLL